MRCKRSRMRTFYLRPHIVERDAECATSVRYLPAVAVTGEIWPAGGNVQSEQYGQRLAYVFNCRILGDYQLSSDSAGNPLYQFDGFAVREKDGLCLNVPADAMPDYVIIAIRPYHPLLMEVERQNGN